MIGDGKRGKGGYVFVKQRVAGLHFFPGYIGDSIVSTPCNLALWNAHITELKSISGDGSLF